MNTLPTTDQQAQIETIPESMPQLQRLETSFADFLEQYDVFINDYSAKKEAGQVPDLQQLLTNLSNDQVTVTYRNRENIEGSFYFKDNKTGDEIRFRTDGTDGNHTYMKDANGSEQLFLYNLNPAGGQNVHETLCRLQGGKNVCAIGSNGIDVTYQTEGDYNIQAEANNRHCELVRQIRSFRSNIFKALWNRKNIQELEVSLAENPNPYEGDRTQYTTEEMISIAASEAIFKKFNNILDTITESLKQQTEK